MDRISKKEFIRLITSNKSCLLHAGLKKLSLDRYIELSKQVKTFYDIRTAKANGYFLTFSNDSHLNLSDYKNNELHVTEIYKECDILLIYNLHKAGDSCNFDTESILIYKLL